MDANVSPVIFLMGPTAVGKTNIATVLYDQFDCELISVDAAQVFRSMNIGTAKPDTSFLQRYPHHLVDIRDVNESYSAAEFCIDAKSLINQIQERGKTPILVGGTMFYFSALENGISQLPAADSEIRAILLKEIEVHGLVAMHHQLSKIDPVLASRISSSDSQRLQRAMEIFRITNCAPSQVMQESVAEKLKYPVVKLCLFTSDRKTLHKQIETRFLEMLNQGLVEEVKSIVNQRNDITAMTSMRTVGYRQVVDYLNGLVDDQQMIENACAATRQLAKRQLTWLRNQSYLTWFDVSHAQTTKAIQAYLKYCPSLSL